MSDRIKKQAAIKRAANKAQDQTTKLDLSENLKLKSLWGKVLADLLVVLSQSSAVDGSVRANALGRIKQMASDILDAHGKDQINLLNSALLQSAQLGAAAFTHTTTDFEIPHRTLAAIKSFIASDGLQLSDRIWGGIEDAKGIFNKRLTSAVVMGKSASEAALDLLGSNQEIPLDLQKKIKGQNVHAVYSDIKNQFFDGPYKQAKLVFTTEINRAHGVAFEAGAQTHPDAIGTKFLLSPNHPRTDICDLHARVNKFGLGAGVYPFGKNPWPAHPGTISYTQVVFDDEVSESDRKNKSDRIAWLKQQGPVYQSSVLGKKKSLALRLGYLKENEINSPWYVLKKRYARRGLDLSAFE